MAGKLFYNDVRLDRAYAEGLGAADGATNPHPAGTPENEAWAVGASEAKVTVEVRQAPVPTSDWTKTQLKEWLDGLSIDYPSDATKAELQALAGIN
jgi:hypothetical protein